MRKWIFFFFLGQQKETGENNSGLDIPAEDEDKETQDCCPAKSHLSQCTCDLELELSGGKLFLNFQKILKLNIFYYDI